MTAALALLYSSAIIVVGAFLFVAVDWLEPNRRLALVFKCTILAAGGAAIARTCCTDTAAIGKVDDFFTQFASGEYANKKLPKFRQGGAHAQPCLERKLATCVVRGMGHDLRCRCANPGA